jgi:hypothetical protein
MHDVWWLINRGIEALRGKTFPRRVTTVSGNTRWQGSSGRSFHTREEAHGRQSKSLMLLPFRIEECAKRGADIRR